MKTEIESQQRSNTWVIMELVPFMTVLIVSAFAATSVYAADVLVGVHVEPSKRVSLDKIDHSQWDDLLHKYVNTNGQVNYTSWKESKIDAQALQSYLSHLSQANLKGTQEEKLAYWINAYNAVTIWGILREYPTSSIRNHTAKIFGYNIWEDLKLRVVGKEVSLDQMEHQILRKMGEPRIHFAIVCASIGCPRLLNEAYTPSKLDQQLSANAKHFFNDRTKFRYSASDKTFYVSSILDWFGEDFGASDKARLQRIASWLPDKTAQQVAHAGQGSFSFLEYDWDLNDQKQGN
ncbi:hypothetical protein Pla110_40480 [Polystyrenella longa]|uniref:DUF547 domain-containing protein n=1 Tax=Polystyrenella longa TaxID=2528007 RepID=A0A518CST6_9PLAN|nr:DUF547 domain-containing protein [Polystyrenella longa]QDU82293.1 hypothetical protein Pla110_40480 [Polystyrenella longa]